MVELLFYEMWSAEAEGHPTVAMLTEVLAGFATKKTSPLYNGAVTKNNDPFHRIVMVEVEDASCTAGALDKSHIPAEILQQQSIPRNRPPIQPLSPEDIAASYNPKPGPLRRAEALQTVVKAVTVEEAEEAIERCEEPQLLRPSTALQAKIFDL